MLRFNVYMMIKFNVYMMILIYLLLSFRVRKRIGKMRSALLVVFLSKLNKFEVLRFLNVLVTLIRN